jgi:hypothetical protein
MVNEGRFGGALVIQNVVPHAITALQVALRPSDELIADIFEFSQQRRRISPPPIPNGSRPVRSGGRSGHDHRSGAETSYGAPTGVLRRPRRSTWRPSSGVTRAAARATVAAGIRSTTPSRSAARRRASSTSSRTIWSAARAISGWGLGPDSAGRRRVSKRGRLSDPRRPK